MALTNYGQSSSLGTSSSGTQVLPQLFQGYQQLLNLNQNKYQNVLDAYQNGQSSLTGQLPGIYQGYGQIQGQVAKTLGQGGDWGVATPAAQAIQRQFAQTRGQTDQQLINSGLGNTTLRGNLANQSTLQEGQAYGGLGAQLAQTYAGYQSQLGLSKQGAMMQGLGMQNQLSSGLGNALAGQNFSNTMGNLMGNQSQSQNASQSSNYGYGGGGGGGGGGAPGSYQSPTSNTPVDRLFGAFGAYGQAPGTGMGYSPGYSFGNYGVAGNNFTPGNMPSNPNLNAQTSGAGGGGINDPEMTDQGIDWSQYPQEDPGLAFLSGAQSSGFFGNYDY
jgi:hypothetical protein